MIREAVLAGLDFLVGGFDFRSFEWGFPNQLSVNNDTNGPDIHLIGVPLSLKNFGCNIVRGSTNGLFLLFIILQPRGQTKISQLNLHILIQEQVS